jgi:crossover junction endodeoxyribonuclease RusA
MSGGIELPWPPTALRPNAPSPGNWRRKFEAAKRYKSDCLILCLAGKLKAVMPEEGNLWLRIEFRPPDRRRRDLDNMIASFKAGIDAVSDAIGIDDYLFSLQFTRGEPVKGGSVVVTIG